MRPTTCIKQPSFSVDGSNNSEFCSEHKEDGMVDVKNKRCCQLGCNTYPSFAVDGSTREFCSKHKRDGMLHLSAVKNRSSHYSVAGGSGHRRHIGAARTIKGAWRKKRGHPSPFFPPPPSSGRSADGNKRSREAATGVPMASTLVAEAPAYQSPTPSVAGHSCLKPAGAAVKMEPEAFCIGRRGSWR